MDATYNPRSIESRIVTSRNLLCAGRHL